MAAIFSHIALLPDFSRATARDIWTSPHNAPDGAPKGRSKKNNPWDHQWLMTVWYPVIPICSMVLIYLRTFGWFLGQMLVNIPCMEHMGPIYRIYYIVEESDQIYLFPWYYRDRLARQATVLPVYQKSSPDPMGQVTGDWSNLSSTIWAAMNTARCLHHLEIWKFTKRSW